MKTITYPNESPTTSLERRVQQLERRLSTALSQIDTLLKGPGSFPVGTIVAYGGTYEEFQASPLSEQGWLPCDGSLVSLDEYPELFDVIGHNHATGTPPPGYFYLPNIGVGTIPWIIRAKSAATVYAEPDVTIDTEVIDD